MSDYGEEVVLEIVQQVAERENGSPLDLPPLSTAIDPELITSLPEGATLEFPYDGYTVTVRGTRAVSIQKIRDEEPASSA